MSRPEITVYWDDDKGEALLKTSPAYEAAMPIVKADMLRDGVFELEKEYRRVLDAGLVKQKPRHQRSKKIKPIKS